MIALLRDGFNAESEGGKIELSNDGSPIIDYKVNDYLWDGVVRSWLSMAEMQFAAGAKATRVSHVDSPWFHSWEEAKAGIPKLEFRSNAIPSDLLIVWVEWPWAKIKHAVWSIAMVSTTT